MWRSHPTSHDSPGSCVLETAGRRLVAIARGSLHVWWIEGVGFRPWNRGLSSSGGLHALAYAAAPDRIFAVDAVGGVWQAPEGGTPTLLGAERAPALGEVSLVWDPTKRRLVLASGDGEQSWAFDGRWTELASSQTGRGGPLRMVGTSDGVYGWRRSGLFRLVAERWELVDASPPDARFGLLYEPRRRLLVFVGDDVVALEPSDPDAKHVLGRTALGDPLEAVGLDPVGDRVVCLAGDAMRELSLGPIDDLLDVERTLSA